MIYSLSTGGLENGLVNILNRSPAGLYEHVIVCITQADDFADRITAENVSVIELHKRAGHDIGYYWRLWKLFRKLRPDIIHTRNLAALETQLMSITNFGVKRVHGEHGREITDLDGSNPKYLALRKLMRLLVDQYIAVSQDLEQWLASAVAVKPDKISQIYNGVDHEQFSPAKVVADRLLPAEWDSVESRVVVGTVGRLSPVKDQQLLLTALDCIRSENPLLFARIRLVLVGDGPLLQTLQEQVRELRLDSHVWLAGNRADIPALLNSMDVFVLPSLGEGISNTLLEAMAAGLPVVATRVGGNTELVEDGVNGKLFPVGDATALACVLCDLLQSAEQLKQFGLAARHKVCEQFDWSRTVNSYLQVYDNLLQQPANRPLRGIS